MNNTRYLGKVSWTNKTNDSSYRTNENDPFYLTFDGSSMKMNERDLRYNDSTLMENTITYPIFVRPDLPVVSLLGDNIISLPNSTNNSNTGNSILDALIGLSNMAAGLRTISSTQPFDVYYYDGYNEHKLTTVPNSYAGLLRYTLSEPWIIYENGNHLCQRFLSIDCILDNSSSPVPRFLGNIVIRSYIPAHQNITFLSSQISYYSCFGLNTNYSSSNIQIPIYNSGDNLDPGCIYKYNEYSGFKPAGMSNDADIFICNVRFDFAKAPNISLIPGSYRYYYTQEDVDEIFGIDKKNIPVQQLGSTGEYRLDQYRTDDIEFNGETRAFSIIMSGSLSGVDVNISNPVNCTINRNSSSSFEMLVNSRSPRNSYSPIPISQPNLYTGLYNYLNTGFDFNINTFVNNVSLINIQLIKGTVSNTYPISGSDNSIYYIDTYRGDLARKVRVIKRSGNNIVSEKNVLTNDTVLSNNFNNTISQLKLARSEFRSQNNLPESNDIICYCGEDVENVLNTLLIAPGEFIFQGVIGQVDEWLDDIAYTFGDTVVYNDKVWRRFSNSSSAIGEPPSEDTDWEIRSINQSADRAVKKPDFAKYRYLYKENYTNKYYYCGLYKENGSYNYWRFPSSNIAIITDNGSIKRIELGDYTSNDENLAQQFFNSLGFKTIMLGVDFGENDNRAFSCSTSFGDTWDNTKIYSKGDLVKNEGHLYKSKINNNTSSLSITNNWELQHIIHFTKIGWDETFEYSLEDVVYYNNSVWISISNNNVGHEPEDGSTYWSKIRDLDFNVEYLSPVHYKYYKVLTSDGAHYSSTIPDPDSTLSPKYFNFIEDDHTITDSYRKGYDLIPTISIHAVDLTWSATKEYSNGDIVYYDSEFWKSEQDQNVNHVPPAQGYWHFLDLYELSQDDDGKYRLPPNTQQDTCYKIENIYQDNSGIAYYICNGNNSWDVMGYSTVFANMISNMLNSIDISKLIVNGTYYSYQDFLCSNGEYVYASALNTYKYIEMILSDGTSIYYEFKPYSTEHLCPVNFQDSSSKLRQSGSSGNILLNGDEYGNGFGIGEFSEDIAYYYDFNDYTTKINLYEEEVRLRQKRLRKGIVAKFNDSDEYKLYLGETGNSGTHNITIPISSDGQNFSGFIGLFPTNSEIQIGNLGELVSVSSSDNSISYQMTVPTIGTPNFSVTFPQNNTSEARVVSYTFEYEEDNYLTKLIVTFEQNVNIGTVEVESGDSLIFDSSGEGNDFYIKTDIPNISRDNFIVEDVEVDYNIEITPTATASSDLSRYKINIKLSPNKNNYILEDFRIKIGKQIGSRFLDLTISSDPVFFKLVDGQWEMTTEHDLDYSEEYVKTLPSPTDYNDGDIVCLCNSLRGTQACSCLQVSINNSTNYDTPFNIQLIENVSFESLRGIFKLGDISSENFDNFLDNDDINGDKIIGRIIKLGNNNYSYTISDFFIGDYTVGRDYAPLYEFSGNSCYIPFRFIEKDVGDFSRVLSSSYWNGNLEAYLEQGSQILCPNGISVNIQSRDNEVGFFIEKLDTFQETTNSIEISIPFYNDGISFPITLYIKI